MIDYEFRLITPTIRKAVLLRSSSEKLLISKIPEKHISEKNIKKLNDNYFKNLPKVNTLIYRSLPINKSKDYFNSIEELEEEFLKLQKRIKQECNRKIQGFQFIQLPNPKLVNFKEFYNKLDHKKYFGFELIPLWHTHAKFPDDYFDYFKFIEKTGKYLSIEINFGHSDSTNSFFNFCSMMKIFPRLKIMMSKLGSGIFLYNNLMKDYYSLKKNKIILITSAPKSLLWLNVLKSKKFNSNFNVQFGTDHPFNGNSSKTIYKNSIKFRIKRKLPIK